MDRDYEDYMANKMIDSLKEEGFKSLRDRERHIMFENAMREYDRYLSGGGEYTQL